MDTDELFDTALTILPGLLASGHYTHTRGETGLPDILQRHNGKDWKDDGHASRFTTLAIEDAIYLAKQLARECENRK